MTMLDILTPTDRRTATVLLVEDDEAILEGIADLLEFSAEKFQIDVHKATHGQLGLESLQATLPDLIISDVSMPVMDGYAFLAAVRNNPKWAHIPFIMLTAQASTREISNGLSQGVELYLTKPFDSLHLIELVETHLSKALQQSEVRETRQTQRKRELSRTLQHELRTPLALVTAYLEFIDMSIGVEFADAPPDPEELQEYLRGIDVGIRRLTRLVSDIIAAIDMRSGRSLKRIRAEAKFFGGVSKLIEEAEAEARLIGDSDHATVIIDMPDNIGLLYGQRAMLKDALVRLVQNAFKFTKFDGQGKITISGTLLDLDKASVQLGYRPEGASGALQIDIVDNGIGFPNHTRFQLQELFSQHDRDTWEQQGPGVGLSIVRGVTQGHNGYLRMRGTPGEGATACLLLPRYDSETDPPELGTAPQPMRSVCVLLVEDDPMVREVFIDLVEVQESEFEYDILLAENGFEALELLKTTVPDLIVSDIRMPKMNGIEMLKAMRQSARLSEIPVIFLTGNRHPEQVHEGRRLGVDEYIAKPYSPEHLFARIDTLLKRSFEKQSAEANNFDVLKERVLASIEVGVVASLKAMAQHSQTMRSVVESDEEIAASNDIDDLRHSLVGIQSNSSKISDMVAKATMLVDIRTGAAAAAFELRSNMIESVGDLIAAVVRDRLRSAENNPTLPKLAISFEQAAMPLPLFGNSKMLTTAFTNLLLYLDMSRQQAGEIGAAVAESDGLNVVSFTFKSELLSSESLQLMRSVTSDMQSCDVSQAELAIFCEYMRLHSAEVVLDSHDQINTLSVKFAPFDINAI